MNGRQHVGHAVVGDRGSIATDSFVVRLLARCRPDRVPGDLAKLFRIEDVVGDLDVVAKLAHVEPLQLPLSTLSMHTRIGVGTPSMVATPWKTCFRHSAF